jgi:DNA-binding MarR family transcriptional regulator
VTEGIESKGDRIGHLLIGQFAFVEAGVSMRDGELDIEDPSAERGQDFTAVLSRAEDGRLKRVELARSLMLTPSGITRLLQGLEDAGLVERASCATDLRVTYAQLTGVGYDKLEAASEGHVASIRALFEEHFARDEIDTIAEIGKLPGVAEGDDSCSPG